MTPTSSEAFHPETIQSAIDRIIRNPDLVALDREARTAESIAGLSHTVPLSTRHTLQMETETRDLARTLSQRDAFALPAQDIQDKLQELREEDYPLSDEQTSAIEYVAGRSGAVSIIEGAAGSGKTTTIRPIVDLYKKHGYNILATAMPWRAADQLANECDIPPYSAEQLLARAAHDKLHLDDKSIIIVEEAGQLPTRHTHRILKLAEENGAKVILLGDTQQQQPIEAGPGLRLITDVVGSHRVDTIRRQLPDAEDVLRDIHGFDPEQAIDAAAALSPADRARVLSEIEDGNRPDHLVPWQISIATNFKNGNAQDAIEACYRRGRLHLRANPESTINKLVDDWHEYVTNNPDKSSVVLARTHEELKLLSLQMRERIHADRVDPKTAVVTVSRGEGKKRENYNLEIRTGDRLRLGGNKLDKKLYTGSLVTVEDLSIQGAPSHHEPRVLITARDDRGRKVTFYHDEIRDFHGNIRLDHGFALTMTSAQGLTIDRAFVLADDAPARETIYPAATRHRERLDLYVSRESPLARIKSNMPDQGAGLETELTDQDILDHLATRWSRHQPKEAATDYTSDELLQEALQSIKTPQPKPSQDSQHEPARQLPLNDNSHTLLSWASKQLRRATLEFRYGSTVAMIAQGHREVSAAYDTLRERARKEGAQVALSPAFNSTLFRHAQVLSAAEPFRRNPEKFSDLLRERGALDPNDLELFAKQYDKAKGAQRQASNDTGHDAAADIPIDNSDLQAGAPDQDSQATIQQTTRRTRALPSAAELSASLALRAEDVCQAYLSHGKREGDQWTAATIQPDKEARIHVSLDGPNAGKWQDRAGAARGDLLDLIQHSRGLETIAEAMKEATAFLGLTPQTRSLTAPTATPSDRAETESARAQSLYDRARPVSADDPAGRYLAQRGLDPKQTPDLRYHDNVYYLAGADLRRSPAILTPITSADGTLRGLHRLFLTPEGEALSIAPHTITGHAPTPPDAATWIGKRNAPNVALCQTVQDALILVSALDAQQRDQLAIVALPETCDLSALPISSETRNLFLVQGDDDAGADAWEALRTAHADTARSSFTGSPRTPATSTAFCRARANTSCRRYSSPSPTPSPRPRSSPPSTASTANGPPTLPAPPPQTLTLTTSSATPRSSNAFANSETNPRLPHSPPPIFPGSTPSSPKPAARTTPSPTSKNILPNSNPTAPNCAICTTSPYPTDPNSRTCPPTRHGTAAQTSSSSKAPPSPMTATHTAPASTTPSRHGASFTAASASCSRTSATTPPRCATSNRTSTCSPSPGPSPRTMAPSKPTRATAACATTGTTTWPARTPSTPIPTRSKATLP